MNDSNSSLMNGFLDNVSPSENGRKQCPECSYRDTEKVLSGERYDRYICHRCSNEFIDYTGPECPKCGSQNTTKKTIRDRDATRHSRSIIQCFECEHNRDSHRHDSHRRLMID